MSKIASSDCVRLSKSLDRRNLEGYIGLMIKSFSHKGLGGFFYDGVKKGIQPKHTNKIATILDRLDAANDIRDMNYPGSGLHLLQPKKEGRWAVKVSGNWRITFRFKDGDAYEVNYEDYH
jgi:proteic killer suppression protein